MTDFLVPIVDTQGVTFAPPIILIDVSGSTADKIKNKGTIRDYEFEIARKLLEQHGQAEIICWSDQAFSLGILKHGDLDEMEEINKKCKKISSGTHMMSGFSLIDMTKFKPEETIHIIILTDGEINDSSNVIGKKLSEFANYKVNMTIIAVETGSKNYLLTQCDVGNTLYRMIQTNGMTRLVNKFLIYNELDTEFTNFSNPTVPKDFIPFRTHMFHRADLGHFIKHVIGLVDEIKVNDPVNTTPFPIDVNITSPSEQNNHDDASEEELEDYGSENEITQETSQNSVEKEKAKKASEDKMKYLKLAHEISLSLYHLTKERQYHEQVAMIDLFANIFKEIPRVYGDVRKLMIDEVNNHMTGKATTFTSLKKNKYTDIENRNISLMENVCGSVVDETKFTDNLYKVSFPIRLTGRGITLIKSTDTLVPVMMGKTKYNHAGIKLNNYTVPLLFRPDQNTISKQMNGLQWLFLNYARVLNLSPSNEYIYYYFLSDAYTILKLNKNNITQDVKELFESYVRIALTNKSSDNSNQSVIEKIMLDGMVKLPPTVFESCASYIGLKIRPLTLFYLLVTEFIVPLVEQTSRDKLVSDLQKFCSFDIRKDLKIDPNEELNWASVHMELTDFALISIKDISTQLNELLSPANKLTIVEINNTTRYVIQSHKITGTNVECGTRLVDSNTNICDLCGSTVNVTIIEPKVPVNGLIINQSNTKQFYFDSSKHVDLGMLDGEKSYDKVIIPDIFTQDNDSVEIKNVMIIDPISSSAMRVRDKHEFKSIVNQKYPFLQTLDMSNVALCGGFCRSILLKQQMKDFDFFFHGLESNDAFYNRFVKLMTDLMNNIRKYDHNIKFGMFFKPMFNVFELVCFEDPLNHINEEFTLENFDKYTFHNLRKYNRRNALDENDKYYFEDGDEKGIRLRYRVQFILCKFASIADIFNSFDMFPSKVAYDGNDVYFTEKSLIAYRHMINEICYYGGSDLFKHRISKYLKYGFSIVFPPNKRNWSAQHYENKYNSYHSESTNENIGPLCFKVRSMIGNQIYINHNSNIEKMLEKNEQLEKTALEKGKALYISSLFCSFVSFLRYIKINEINYIFPQLKPDETSINLDTVFQNHNFNSRIGTVNINFIEKYETIYKTKDWYDKFVEDMILNDFN